MPFDAIGPLAEDINKFATTQRKDASPPPSLNLRRPSFLPSIETIKKQPVAVAALLAEVVSYLDGTSPPPHPFLLEAFVNSVKPCAVRDSPHPYPRYFFNEDVISFARAKSVDVAVDHRSKTDFDDYLELFAGGRGSAARIAGLSGAFGETGAVSVSGGSVHFKFSGHHGTVPTPPPLF